MSLVRIARFADLTEAQVVASALRAAGVAVLLQNEQLGQTNFTWQQAIGGFGIWTPEEQAADAAEFIRQHRTEDFQAARPDDIDTDTTALGDDEDWSLDANRRKGMVVRWMVVAIVVGPPASALLVFAVSIFLRGVASVFTGR